MPDELHTPVLPIWQGFKDFRVEDEHRIDLSGLLQGMVERGVVEVAEITPKPDRALSIREVFMAVLYWNRGERNHVKCRFVDTQTGSMHGVPYWRLSSFYFFYFAVGAFSPHWSLYQGTRIQRFQIGVLMSLLQVARIFAPNAWGWLADHTGRRVAVVQLAALLSLISYLGVFMGDSFAWLFVVMLAVSLFWSASLPLVEAITLGHLGEGTAGYGRIRLWGSVGFIIAVVVLGYVLDVAPVRALLWVVLCLKFGVLLFTRHIPEPRFVPHHTDDQSVWVIVRRPEVASFCRPAS